MDAMFERDERISALTVRIQRECSGRKYSDIVEDSGERPLQYVDLVMEGGGVLGIALVGYVHALETAGIRFLSIGGTSAGSILALLLMACDDRERGKSSGLLDIVAAMDMRSFVDGDADARDFSLLLAKGNAASKPLSLIWKGAQVLDNLRDDFGLNPGDAFRAWLDAHLQNFGTPTLGELERRIRHVPPGLMHRNTRETIDAIQCELGIVAADISTETKVVFPRMAPLYWPRPEAVSPALFVRASMSIPLFFQPFRVRGVSALPDAAERWKTYASYEGSIPNEAVFADGGVMSNFPIGLFHEPGVPAAPTFGIKLGTRSRRARESRSVFEYSLNLFNAIRHYADYEFIMNNPDYNALIGYIDTSGHNWLNFFMNDSEKIDLFFKGMQAGYEFLSSFDWEAYKAIRAMS